MNNTQTLAIIKHINQKSRQRAKVLLLTPTPVIYALGILFPTLIGKSPVIYGIPIIIATLAFWSVCVVILTLIGSAISRKFDKKIRKLYKDNFVRNALAQSFEEASYEWEHGFAESRLWNFGITPHGDAYQSEDHIKGIYNDIHFEFADVSIKNNKNVSKNYFEGGMLVFDFPCDEIAGIQVFSKFFEHVPAAPIGKQLTVYSTGDELFDRLFTVKSVTAEDVSKFFTQPIIARIMALRELCNGIAMYFSEGKLFLGLNGVFDSFEPLNVSHFNFEYEQKYILKNIQQIKDVMDTMTQNTVM